MRTHSPTLRLLAATASITAVSMVLPASGAGAEDTVLRATLSGAKEVPGPGDPDGKGRARITIDGTRVCWRLVAERIAKPTAAHIHRAPAGRAGPIVVNLFLTPRSLERAKRGCVRAERSLAKDIAKRPRRYYVNVHNLDHQAGAIRGQLSR